MNKIVITIFLIIITFKTEAVIIFNTLKAKDSTNPNYHYELGVVLERLSQETDAQNCFKKAFRIDSTHQKAIYKLSRHSLKNKAFERLDTLLTVGLNSYPKNAALISLKVQSLFLQNDYTKAIVWFENLLALGDKSQFVFEKLSHAYKKELEYEKAIECMEQALLFEPKNTENLFKLGSLYQLINDYKKAEKYIKQALELQDLPLDREYSKLATLKENPKNESTKFFIVLTKASYYKDLQSKIELFENYIEKNPESNYITQAKWELKKLTKERFLKVEEQKN